MSDLNTLVNDLQGKINKQNTLISKLKEQNIDSADFNVKLEEKEREIAALKSKVTELNAKIEDFTKQQEFDVLVNQIKGKDEEIAKLKEQLTEKDNLINEKDQKIKEIETQIPACQELIQDLQQQLSVRMQSPAFSTPSFTSDVDTGYYPKPSMLSQTSAPPPSPVMTSPPGASTPQVHGAYSTPGEMERQCPQCGASGFAIKEFEDKTKLLSYTPKVYAKKRVCTKCSYEF